MAEPEERGCPCGTQPGAGVRCLGLAQWLSAAPLSQVLFVTREGRELTRQDLLAVVSGCLEDLRQRPGTHCALCFDNGFLFCAALLACLHAGRTPVLHGSLQPRSDADSGAQGRVLLTDQEGLGSPPLRLPPPGASGVQDGGRVALPALPAQAMLLLHTSGTTGERRVVAKSVAQLDAEARLTCSLYGPRLTGLLLCSSVRPGHLYGLSFRIFLPMALSLPSAADLIGYSEQLCAWRGRPLALISSPAFLSRLDTALPPPQLRFVLSSGGQLQQSAVRRLQEWCGVQPDEIYGSTESGVVGFRRRDGGQELWQLPPGVQLSGSDEEPVLHAAHAAAPQGLPLSDRLRRHGDGRFELLGRRDRIVKIEDRRISLTEVRTQLLACSGVADCEVVVVQAGRRACLGAVVVLSQADEDGRAGRRLASELRTRLEAHCVPRRFVFTSAIPTDSLGKRPQALLTALFDAAT